MSLARLLKRTPVGTRIMLLKPCPLCHAPGLEVGQLCPEAILCPSAGRTSSPVPLPLHRDRAPFCSSVWWCGDTCTQSHEHFKKWHDVIPSFYCWGKDWTKCHHFGWSIFEKRCSVCFFQNHWGVSGLMQKGGCQGCIFTWFCNQNYGPDLVRQSLWLAK